MMSYSELKYSDYFKTELPSHWQEKRLGFLSMQTKNAFVDGPFGSDLKSDDYLDEGIPLIQLNNIRDGKHILRNMKFISQNKKIDLIRHLALPQDIVIAKMAEPVARAAVVSDEYDEYVIVADCVKLSPDLELVDLNFLIWAINSDCVRENAELVSTGTTRIRINLGELKKLKVPYPSLSEQVKIRQYLDHETAKIDTLIAKQEKLIELLKEKRQAVISHAVTKGLNPNVPMKDSDVEWLGKVPEHWIVTKFGFYTLKIGSGKTPKGGAEIYQDEGILFIRSQNVYNDGLRVESSESTYISEAIHDDMSTSKVYSGDILLNITGGSIGRSCLVPDEFPEANVNQHVCIIRVSKYLQEFLALVIQSDLIQAQIQSIQTGGNREGLNFEQISKFYFALPPTEEQKQLVKHLKDKVLEFSKLEVKAHNAIQLMQERRTALISAAVTGKIDVRHWQSPNKNNNQDNMELSA